MSINIFKRSAIGLMVLGIASVSFAGTTILGTALSGAFIGGEGLDLQARNGDLDYVTVYPVTDVDSFQVNNLHPNYSWGWKIFGGLKFCGNEDVTVGYQAFDNSRSAQTLATDPADPDLTIPRYLAIGAWTGVTSHVNFKVNEAWGVYGHTFKMAAWSFRLGGGVEWARVNSNFQVNAFDDDGDTVGYLNKSKMSGWGPRGELDMGYHFPYNVTLFANTNLAVLVSSRDISLNTLNTFGGTFPSVGYSNRHIVIPKVGMRLGLGYGYTFGMGGGEGASPMMTTVAVALGWQVESYIHAIERSTSPTPLVFLNTDTKISNFGDQGLFLGVKVSADWM